MGGCQRWGGGGMSQKALTSRRKINKSLEVMHSMVTLVNETVACI